MENEELAPIDDISQSEERLEYEINREEGQGSWDEIEQEEEENVEGEIESGSENQETPVDNQDVDADDIEGDDEQKNTPEENSRRVLSFKDFFDKN